MTNAWGTIHSDISIENVQFPVVIQDSNRLSLAERYLVLMYIFLNPSVTREVSED
jgi:hypothetical protein